MIFFYAFAIIAAILCVLYALALIIFLFPYRRVAEKGDMPFVSVIIATKNEEAVIEKTLRALRKMDYPKFEIILIDASTDNTEKVAKKYVDKLLIDTKSKGKAPALNEAIRHAKGEILYIVDADSVVEKDTLKKLVRALGSEYEAAVGLNLPSNCSGIVSYISRLELAFLNSVDKILNTLVKTAILPGRNYIIYKKSVIDVGGFHDVLTEDVNISWRLYASGKKANITPAICQEQVPNHIKWSIKQQERWNFGSTHEIKEAARHLKSVDKFIYFPYIVLLGACLSHFFYR